MYSTESRQLNRAARSSPRGAYFFSPCIARANPPFNLKNWRLEDELIGDPRWSGYTTPRPANANYAWILHMLSKLDVNHGVAGFLLANGALLDSDFCCASVCS